MATIQRITAREILDSRGFPTVEAEVICNNNIVAMACVPSGASTGSLEALELRDNDKKRYFGKGVLNAVNNIRTKIHTALSGMDVCAQGKIDSALIELDGTNNKANLGANSILAVSMACARAASIHKNIPLYEYLNSFFIDARNYLPIPMMNILNGGAHADNNVDIQEFMIIPVKATTFCESVRWGVEVYHVLKSLLLEHGLATSVGDEGGFAPNLPDNEAALAIIERAIKTAGFQPGKDIYIGLDVAASELYHDNTYNLASQNKNIDAKALTEIYRKWCEKYPILSIEDGLAENDWEGWKYLTDTLGGKVQLVGDDLFVTNTDILKKGIASNVANSILIKLNQIGTVTETIDTIIAARSKDYNAIISHRSGETEDSFIADLAVASGVGQIKTGAPCRSDRNAKYNQLIRISESITTMSQEVYDNWIK